MRVWNAACRFGGRDQRRRQERGHPVLQAFDTVGEPSPLGCRSQLAPNISRRVSQGQSSGANSEPDVFVNATFIIVVVDIHRYPKVRLHTVIQCSHLIEGTNVGITSRVGDSDLVKSTVRRDLGAFSGYLPSLKQVPVSIKDLVVRVNVRKEFAEVSCDKQCIFRI